MKDTFRLENQTIYFGTERAIQPALKRFGAT